MPPKQTADACLQNLLHYSMCGQFGERKFIIYQTEFHVYIVSLSPSVGCRIIRQLCNLLNIRLRFTMATQHSLRQFTYSAVLFKTNDKQLQKKNGKLKMYTKTCGKFAIQ